jgi:hypothetical protein
VNRYLAINIEGKIGQPTIIRTSSFITVVPLPPKATPLIRPDFRYIEIVKYYEIVPLKRGYPSYKAIFTLLLEERLLKCLYVR